MLTPPLTSTISCINFNPISPPSSSSSRSPNSPPPPTTTEQTQCFMNVRVSRQLPIEERRLNRLQRQKRKKSQLENKTPTPEPQVLLSEQITQSSSAISGSACDSFELESQGESQANQRGILKEETFMKFLENKLKELQRQHVMITDDQHDLLVYLAREDGKQSDELPVLLENETEYAWAEGLIDSCGLQVITAKDGRTQKEKTLLVQPKIKIQPGFKIDPEELNRNLFQFYKVLPRFSEIEEILTLVHCNSAHCYEQIANRAGCYLLVQLSIILACRANSYLP
jgi:hypothetical protein